MLWYNGRLMRRIFLFMAVVCIAVPAQARFLDGQREGFFVTVGVGGGYTTFTHEFKVTLPDSTVEWKKESDNTLGPSFVLRVGGGLGNQAQIFFTMRSVWFEEPSGATRENEIITSTHTGLGMTLFKNLQSPTLYYFGSVGFSHLWAPFAEDSHTLTGFGIVGGIGYEIFHTFGVEVTASYGAPKTSVEVVKIWSFGASLSITVF